MPSLKHSLKRKKILLDLLKVNYHFQIKAWLSLEFKRVKSHLELNHLLSQMHGDYFLVEKLISKKMIILSVIHSQV